MPLSPAAAAKIADVSRSLISKEIKAGNLLGKKNNRGNLEINQGDLEDWMSRRTVRAKADPVTTPAPTSPDAERIRGLEVEVLEVRARLNDAFADRDSWKAQAERLAEAGKPGLFARLFR
jgi:hypothetical protein